MSGHAPPPSPHEAGPARFRTPRGAQILRVLVVSPCGFVRLALAHRLAGMNAALTVDVDHGDRAVGGYDAVILGPYLEPGDRDHLVDQISSAGSGATVIEICDPPEETSARLVSLGRGTGAHVVDALLAAIGEPRPALPET